MSSRERSRSRSRSPRAGARRYFNDSPGGNGKFETPPSTIPKNASFRSTGSVGSSSSVGINQGLYSSALHSHVKSGLEIVEQSRISRLLEKYSTQKYHIEFPVPLEGAQGKKQQLSNHLSAGAISLYRIGAPLEQIRKFCEHYTKRLTWSSPSISISNHGELQNLFGKRDNFGAVRDFFENGCRRGTFRKCFLTILKTQEGFLTSSSALHPIIHTGWALMGDIEDSTRNFLFSEGMAYCFCNAYDAASMFKHQWQQTSLGPFNPKKSRFESVKLDKDKPLITEIFIDLIDQLQQEQPKIISELHRVADVEPFNQTYGKFVRRHLACMYHPEFRLRLDTQSLFLIMSLPFDKGATAVGRQIVLCSLCLYTMTEQRNEFFLLHGVTCTYSILKLLEMVGDTQPDIISKIASEAVTILFGTYLAIDEGAPAFIENTAQHGILLATAQNDLKCLKRLPHWLLEANNRALAGKDGNADEFFDEHVYKMLDVACEMWRWPEVQHNERYRAMVAQVAKDVFVANHAIKHNTSSV